MRLKATWPRWGSWAEFFPRSPRMAISTLLRREKRSFVLMKLVTSEYDSFLLSDIMWDNRWIISLHLGPVPPVVRNTRGSKDAFSTSLTLSPYVLIFSFSWRSYTFDRGRSTFETAKGCVTLTSYKVRSKVEWIPRAEISKRASSAVLVLVLKLLGLTVRSIGSVVTSWQTSFMIFAIESRNELWRRET